MNIPSADPLTEAELDFLDKTLLKYGNDDSILSVSGLDGFLTAIVSGPQTIVPSRWLPALWGASNNPDAMPTWDSEAEFNRFMHLAMQNMNANACVLMEMPEQFEALFMENTRGDSAVFVAEDWCFGYMQGVDTGEWPTLPKDVATWLDAIALHGREENFDTLGDLTLAEHQQTVAEIEPAARKLHAHWLALRSRTNPAPLAAKPLLRGTAKVGRNAPCPCGSGKKFKQCCLH